MRFMRAIRAVGTSPSSPSTPSSPSSRPSPSTLLATLVASLAFSSSAFAARSWERIAIPGATCGDGSPYSVFLSPKDPEKVVFELMGGGACWNRATCYGPTFLALMRQLPFALALDGFSSDDPRQSPVSDRTFVHFPYCTGDVHAGRHVATYAFGAKARHVGALNFEAALRHLEETGRVSLGRVSSFTFYGASAGGIGALLHAPSVERKLPPGAEKVIIADAPGMHFGSTFWTKFPAAYKGDMFWHLNRLGVTLAPGEGNVAAHLPAICRALSNWRVAVLQGSRDFAMANVFGSISGREHEKLVYGERGIRAATRDPNDNCSSWVARSATHTFLLASFTAREKAAETSALRFAFDTQDGYGGADAFDP